MKTRLLHIWEILSSSYWFVPSMMVVAAIALAFVLVGLDRHTDETWVRETGLVYLGGPEGARALLSTVAASVITVAGVVFSITIAALTQASSQFGPRLLRNFMRDTGNQIVLGTFVATFIYCLLVLRTVYGTEELSFVPHIAVTVATLLAVASLGVLIFFVHHVSISLQAPHVVSRIAAELTVAIAGAFPEERPRPEDDPENAARFEPAGESRLIRACRAGYLQAIEHGTLIQDISKSDLLVRLRVRPGHFLTTGGVIAEAFPSDRTPDDFDQRLDRRLLIGSSRSGEQDVEFGIVQLVEIAVRALSPGVNDPFSAVHCVDWLGEALGEIARRPAPPSLCRDPNGTPRLIKDPPTFPGLVGAAFNQIRQHASGSVAVTVRLLEAIACVAQSARTAEQRAALLFQADMIRAQAALAFTERHDLESVERRYESARRALLRHAIS
jgi:uncharacterized membrane protein